MIFERMRQAFRFTTILVFIVLFLLTSMIYSLVVRERWRQTRGKMKLMSAFARWGLIVLGIEVVISGENLPTDSKNHLIVSNHLSYLDILIMSASLPTCYVTSVEIRETPVLGDICKWANCLFVERRNKVNLSKEVSEISEALAHGVNVTVFPEATSTNGESVLRFRRPLYRAAIDSGVSVLPLCLNYRQVGGEPLRLSNRDLVFWYGDMGFPGHLWQVAGLGRVEVEISVLPEVASQQDGLDETELANKTHSMVCLAFQPCLS